MKAGHHEQVDVAGARCPNCDAVVEARVFGGPSDYFKVIVETVVERDGARKVERHIIPKDAPCPTP